MGSVVFKMSRRRPLSELTLKEANSFLENLICQTQGSGVSNLQWEKGEDVSDEDRAQQITESYGIMSNFDVGSTGSQIEPEAVMTATCVVLSGASNVASLRFPDLTMHKMLASLQRIEGKLDQMLAAPLNKAFDYYKSVINAVVSEDFKLAFEKLPLLMDNATTAFHYANKKNIGIESYRECCKAIRLLIFATILHASYDEERWVFISPDKLTTKKLSYILRELEDIISRSSEQKKNVKLKSFGLFTVTKKSEVQDLLDSILKITYPYISQARKLSDMNKQLEYSQDGLKFSLLPEALPMGYEDKTPVIIGFQTDENGMRTVVKVNVWKEETCVCYEHKGVVIYKAIISESEPVDMEDAESRITLSAPGRDGEWSYYLCDYSLTGEMHRGRPVYRSTEGRHLYCLDDGAWGVDDRVGDSAPVIRSTSTALSPALCKHWEYQDYDGKYKPGDIKITFK